MRLAFVQVGVSIFWCNLHYVVLSFCVCRLVSACIWFPQYMKNLEFEADKANEHLEEKLLPKDMIDRSEELTEEGEQTSEKEVKPDTSQDEVKKDENVSVRERKAKKKVSIKEPNEEEEKITDESAETEDNPEDKEDPKDDQITIDESKKDK